MCVSMCVCGERWKPYRALKGKEMTSIETRGQREQDCAERRVLKVIGYPQSKTQEHTHTRENCVGNDSNKGREKEGIEGCHCGNAALNVQLAPVRVKQKRTLKTLFKKKLL